jgi:hypothetical protein
MLTLTTALAEHSCRIMTFRHDGRGLPMKKGGVLYFILAIAIAARLGRDLVDPAGISAIAAVLACVVYAAVALLFFQPYSMAALLLANLFGYALVSAFYLADITNPYLTNGVLVWELAALFVVLNKTVRRAQANHKKSNSSKN